MSSLAESDPVRAGTAGRKTGLRGISASAAPPPTAGAMLQATLHSLPRRESVIDPATGRLGLPLAEPVHVRTSLGRSLWRLLAWLRILLSLGLGIVGDTLLRRDTMERRAVRLRRALERAGGTFVKLGQQAAMRIDLLPWAYCLELSKMLDQMQPFPFEKALAAI